MSEDKDLLDRIAKISGQINLHKSHVPSTTQSPAAPVLRGGYRVAPYSRGRGRGGRGGPSAHRNRTLILKNITSQADQSESEEALEDGEISDAKPAYVSKRDRHMQLINTSIYEKDTQQRHKAIEETRKQRIQRKDQKERQKVIRHIQMTMPSGNSDRSSASSHELMINGLRFHVTRGGSKLVRIKSPLDSTSSTPKEAEVGGVRFLRSKNGNLYRSGVVKAQRRSGKVKKISAPCKRFTSTGQCSKGPLCPYTHDPNKVAMCKDFLQKGECPSGPACDLSHDPTPERVPACLHFLRGKCSNPSCRYAHIHVNPAAPVCKDFGSIGYCGRGEACPHRHVHECPEYANTGNCPRSKCHLPHIDRAGQLKKRIATHATNGAKPAGDEDSDLVSDDEEEEDSDDVDSDGMDMIMDDAETASHAFSQQDEFVRF